MLDDKDSVILSARITYDDYWASIAYTFSGDAKDGVKLMDAYRFYLYAMDKIKKIVVPTREEMPAYTEKVQRNFEKWQKN